VGSCASSKTRRLNSSQLNSRLIKFCGSEKSRLAGGSLGGGIGTTLSGDGGMDERTFDGIRNSDFPNWRREDKQTLSRFLAQINVNPSSSLISEERGSRLEDPMSEKIPSMTFRGRGYHSHTHLIMDVQKHVPPRSSQSAGPSSKCS